VDVDSTVWDTGAWVRAAALEVVGETPDEATISTWTHVLDAYGEAATTSIFDRVFDPARVRKREPYPGATEVLHALQRDAGVGIHFVTRNDPDTVGRPLELWLKEHFGPEVGLTVTAGDKLGILGDLGAFGLIDDRPETLAQAADAGLWTATKLQPWNRDLVARRPDVQGFSDWREVPALIQGWVCGRNADERGGGGVL
jgi:phosphoglycolate phosphatase-like HAD superfamily hydrolase